MNLEIYNQTNDSLIEFEIDKSLLHVTVYSFTGRLEKIKTCLDMMETMEILDGLELNIGTIYANGLTVSPKDGYIRVTGDNKSAKLEVSEDSIKRLTAFLQTQQNITKLRAYLKS